MGTYNLNSVPVGLGVFISQGVYAFISQVKVFTPSVAVIEFVGIQCFKTPLFVLDFNQATTA